MELKTPATWMEKYLDLVLQFNQDIVKLPIPDSPTRLDPERKAWANSALTEELAEFMDAAKLEDEIDALLDLTYFALGRVVEMGVVPGAAFEEVHAANMAKVKGEMSKRPHAKGFDAIKPDGWQPPNLLPYLSLDRRQIRAAYETALSEREATECFTEPGASPEDTGKPKLLVIGHAEHGKDTAAEILERDYGFKFVSSSLFCAEKVIMVALRDPAAALARHAKAGRPGLSLEDFGDELDMMRQCHYADAEACFEDRREFRKIWFSLIAGYAHEDKSRLAREIFADNDIYVGLRNPREFRAVINAGLVDGVIWVDAGERLPTEDPRSMGLEPWMADWIIDNNGSEEDLAPNIHQLMSTLGIERNTA